MGEVTAGVPSDDDGSGCGGFGVRLNGHIRDYLATDA